VSGVWIRAPACANKGIRFCNQDEDHDPSEEYEEYLTCAVCGDHCMLNCGPQKLRDLRRSLLIWQFSAHRQCAREQDALLDAEGMYHFFFLRSAH
jgi:hypothetical protein